MKIGEFHALVGQPVDMGCLDIGVTVAAHLVVALVVRENEHHVRLLGIRVAYGHCGHPNQGDEGGAGC